MNIKKFPVIYLGLILFIAYSLYYMQTGPLITSGNIHILGYFCIIQLVYTLCSWYYLDRAIVTPYVVFVIALYAFNLGQPILESLGCAATRRNLLDGHFGVNNAMYFAATYIGLFFSLAFHMGAVLKLKIKSTEFELSDSLADNDFHLKMKAIWRVGWVVFFLTLPFYLYKLIDSFTIIAASGYLGLYDEDVGNVLVSRISWYYAPALICLFFVSEYYKRRVFLIRSLILSTLFLPPLVLGGRSNAVIILAIFLIVYVLFHKIKVRQLLMLGVAAYLFLIALTLIGKTRIESQKTIDLYEQVLDDQDDNMAVEALTEMGWSLYPMAQIYDAIPERIPYKYGESYLYAFFSLIPNLGFWDLHPAAVHANLGNWLEEYTNLGYGPGFSIIAEAYYNFGYWGFLIFILTGYLYCMPFQHVSKKDVYGNPFLFVVAIIFLWFVVKTVRNSFLDTVRALFYVCLPLYIMVQYTYRRYVHR